MKWRDQTTRTGKYRRLREIQNQDTKKASVRKLYLFVFLREKVVGVTGLEPATSCSQSTRATICATPRSISCVVLMVDIINLMSDRRQSPDVRLHIFSGWRKNFSLSMEKK